MSVVLVPVLFIIMLFSIDSLITTEYETVKVEIVEANHTPTRSYPMMVGKSVVMHTDPEKYEVVVNYEGKNYAIDDESTYELYKDKIGEIVDATLEIRRHENGKVWYDIVALKGETS